MGGFDSRSTYDYGSDLGTYCTAFIYYGSARYAITEICASGRVGKLHHKQGTFWAEWIRRCCQDGCFQAMPSSVGTYSCLVHLQDCGVSRKAFAVFMAELGRATRKHGCTLAPFPRSVNYILNFFFFFFCFCHTLSR